MIAALKRIYANFRGFDIDGSSVPPMDGPFRPNAKLDEAPALLKIPDVDNLVQVDGALFCSSSKELLGLKVTAGKAKPKLALSSRVSFDHPVSALAATGDGGLAVALDGHGIVIRGGPNDGLVITGPDGNFFLSITALAADGQGALYICNGSRAYKSSDWKRDLMTKGSSGSIWKVDLSSTRTQPKLLADELAFPSGLVLDGARLLFSESWRHRMHSIDLANGKVTSVQTGFPAYPGRIIRGADGFWICFFAPRNPLVEFVLKEKEYCKRMVETIAPDYWIAPSLLAGQSFLEPIQGGTRKKLNILKPWAPTWSWGLLIQADSQLHLQRSFHSRADGLVHGITSALPYEEKLLVAAKGSGVIVALDLTGQGNTA